MAFVLFICNLYPEGDCFYDEIQTYSVQLISNTDAISMIELTSTPYGVVGIGINTNCESEIDL
jgi:hypothetical protein